MGQLPVRKKVLVGTFALGTVLVPVIFGASAQNVNDGPLPVVRIAPEYPAEALAAEREGSVELQFTIAANGTTKDVVVLDSSSPEFEAPAIAALLRWRYLKTNTECVGVERPPAEGSSARPVVRCTENPNLPVVERPGIRTVIRYELDEQGNPNRAQPVP
jgi:TonB family protein